MSRMCKGLCFKLAIKMCDKYKPRFGLLRTKVRLEIGEKKCRHCLCVYPPEATSHCPCCGSKLATKLISGIGRKKRLETIARY